MIWRRFAFLIRWPRFFCFENNASYPVTVFSCFVIRCPPLLVTLSSSVILHTNRLHLGIFWLQCQSPPEVHSVIPSHEKYSRFPLNFLADEVTLKTLSIHHATCSPGAWVVHAVRDVWCTTVSVSYRFVFQFTSISLVIILISPVNIYIFVLRLRLQLPTPDG